MYEEITKLKHDNMELEAIFSSSYDGIVVADGNGVLLRISDSYPRITGLTKEELLGTNIDDMVSKGIVAPSGTSFVLSRKEKVTLTQTFKSGMQSLITSTPVFDEEGNIIRVVTNVRDMKELHALKDKLADSEKKINHYSQVIQSLTIENTNDSKMIFRSASMQALRKRAIKFSLVDVPLLITGDSGVGKEVFANFIHQCSPRSSAPFLKINCGAIPEHLLESELFGYEGGAFTGARREGRPGFVEMAKGGTLLLDEIGELPLNLQVKLLRFVQNKEFFRVGGSRPLEADVRIITATNLDLEKMVQEKKFRMDLFYRLNVLMLRIPPLSERREDIVPLTHYFLEKFNKKYNTNKLISTNVYRMFEQYGWPGNIRELENIIERLVIVNSEDMIESAMLPDEFKNDQIIHTPFFSKKTYKESLLDFEKTYWTQVLKKYKSYRIAAKELGIDHSTIVKKVARLGIIFNK